ncbi:MAG: sulfotransferase domain-containing protein [Opitutales bacterium]
MPFVLAPGIWRHLQRTSSEQHRQWSHKDGIRIGVSSVEALEEYFFKNKLTDRYILEDQLIEHNLPRELYEDYLIYQAMVRTVDRGEVDLAKNNNLILRYESLRGYNANFSVICMLRNPLEHAYSLLKQQQRFVSLQQADPFVRQYMDWLGHHEFGLNHKPFRLQGEEQILNGNPNDFEYWLQAWYHYYSRVLSLKDWNRFHVMSYEALADSPESFFTMISEATGYELNLDDLLPFKKTIFPLDLPVDHDLLSQCRELHARLSRTQCLSEYERKHRTTSPDRSG